ncbi:MAG TPA: ParB/RepB/Spo0J family partition protein, partial [Vicinamibacteria bacterium]|nr:ParB/RepB/Spo0J family partition protein [Vicinamibacteria bacterium]
VSTKRKALGRGLSALIPEPDPPAPGPAPAGEVPTSALDPNPFQPRGTLDPARLAELSASILESGIVQPILVRRRGERFQIIAGERRFRAAQAAGLATVPVTVRDVDDEHLLELALVENIQREELNPIEEAQAFHRLQDEFRLTQEEIARRVGRDRTTVANTLRLLRLPRELREMVGDSRLDAGHARALLALDRAEDQVALGREAARRGLSVREVERRVALLRAPRAARSRKDANTRAAEERLRAALGARVEIARRGRGGAIRVLFAGEAELNRLFELLVRAGRGR